MKGIYFPIIPQHHSLSSSYMLQLCTKSLTDMKEKFDMDRLVQMKVCG